MYEYSRLCDSCLLEVIGRTGEHYAADVESEDVACAVDEFLGLGACIVQILAHPCKLCSLSGKNISSHILFQNLFVHLHSFSPP